MTTREKIIQLLRNKAIKGDNAAQSVLYKIGQKQTNTPAVRDEFTNNAFNLPSDTFIKNAPNSSQERATAQPPSQSQALEQSRNSNELNLELNPELGNTAGETTPQTTLDFSKTLKNRVIKNPPPETFTQKAERFLTTPFRRSAKDQVARDQAVYAISKNTGIDPLTVDKNLDSITKQLGLRQLPTTEEYIGKMLMMPVVAGLMTNPITTGLGVGAFQAMSELENFVISKVKNEKYQFGKNERVSSLLPSEVNQKTKDFIDILDFLAKGKALHTVYKNKPAIIDKFTRNLITTYNLPRDVYIEGSKIKSIFQTGDKISSEELKLVQSLGLDAKGYRQAIANGLTIKVPAEVILTQADKPWFAKLKSILKLEPGETKKVVIPQGKTEQAPRGFLEAPKENLKKESTPTENPSIPLTPPTPAKIIGAAPIRAQLPTGQPENATPVEDSKIQATKSLVAKLTNKLAEKQAIAQSGRGTPDVVSQVKKLQAIIENLNKKIAEPSQAITASPISSAKTIPAVNKPETSNIVTKQTPAPQISTVTARKPIKPKIKIESTKVDTLYHGSENGKFKIDRRGNINLGTSKKEVERFGKPIKLDTSGMKIANFKTKGEMFNALSNKAYYHRHGYDILKSGNHAIAISPKNFASSFNRQTFNRGRQIVSAMQKRFEAMQKPAVKPGRPKSQGVTEAQAYKARKKFIQRQRQNKPKNYADYLKEAEKLSKPKETPEQIRARLAKEKAMVAARRARGQFTTREIELGLAERPSTTYNNIYNDLKKLKAQGKDRAYFADLHNKYLLDFLQGKSNMDKSEVVSKFIDDNFGAGKEEKYIQKLSNQRGSVLGSKMGISIISDSITQLDFLSQKIFGNKALAGGKWLIDKITPTFLKEWFVYGYGRPQSWLDLQTQVEVERNQYERKVHLLTKKLAKLKPEEIKMLRKIIESGDINGRSNFLLLESPGTPSTRQEPNKLVELANEVSDMFFELGKDLVRYNLLTPEQFAKYAKVYFPYFYKIFDKNFKIFSNNFIKRLDLSYAKKRKDLPEEVREALQLIDDSPEPIAKRLIQEGGDIALARMFEASYQMGIGTDNPTTENTVKLPKTKKLGSMSGKYVNKYVAEDLEMLLYTPEKADQIFQTLWGTWKMGKVVLNPATVSRNIMSNIWLADIAGNLPAEDIPTWVSAIKDVIDYYKKGKDVKDLNELVNFGTVGTEFWKEEIHGTLADYVDKSVQLEKDKNGVWQKSKSILPTLLKTAAKFADHAGEFYNLLEVIAKLAVYKKNVYGFNIPKKEAAKIAENALFNYGKVTPLINQLRRGGGKGPLPQQIVPLVAQPFITFRYKVYPLLLKSMVQKPFTWAKWLLLYSLVTGIAAETWGISKEEIKKQKDQLTRQTGKFVIPNPQKPVKKGKESQYSYQDFSYIFPGGDFLQIVNDVKTDNMSALINDSNFGSNPYMQFTAALLTNKDPYFGNDIYNQFDTLGEASMKYLGLMYNTFSPSFLGYGITRLYRGLLQKPTRWGETESRKSAILSTLFGLKQIPYLQSIQDQRNSIELKGLENEYYRQLYRIAGDSSTNKEQKKKSILNLTKNYERKIKAVLQAYKK